MDYKLYLAGQWVETKERMTVYNKYSGAALGTLPLAGPEELERALSSAAAQARSWGETAAWKRSEVLQRMADGILQRREDFARTIAAEAGKAMKFARLEVERAASTFRIAAEEAKRIHGETIPLDAVPSGEGFFGFFQRRPVGVVAAIAPFNFPLNLVAHKVAPALAAGNTIVLKPASSTPLTSVLLCEVAEAAGLPAGVLHLVVGSGRTVGDALVADPRVAKVTFTGSAEVGRQLVARAGIKKVTLELGNNSPVIVAPDADLDLVAKRCAVGAFANSGQVCISVQRMYGDRRIIDELTERTVRASEAMVVGDPLDERVDVGPMIDSKEAVRIEGWVQEAQLQGASVLCGGKRENAVYWPTVLDKVTPEMKVICQEAFAPVVSLLPYDDFEDALAQADASEYGLQAAVFTRDIGRVFQAIKRLNFGGVIINEAPTFRADHMPYGGNRQSGLGREGLRYAIEEMTNIQLVAVKL